WRYGNTVAITGLSVEGKAEFDETEVGDVDAGLNSGGPEDSESPVPFALAAFRGESFAGELYSNIGDGLKTDIEQENVVTKSGTFDKSNVYKEEKKLFANLAYVFGETVSIGIGYRSINNKQKQETTVGANTEQTDTDVTTVGTSISGSIRLAEIFFIAAGMESVKETGTYKTEGLLLPADADTDFVENSWTNTLAGLGVIVGDPGDTQFRAEYSMISSPESEEKDDAGVEETSEHPQTTTTFVSAEVKFGDFLIGYNNETEIEAELNGKESETITTSIGIGWVPLEGLSISAYSLENKVTSKDDSLGESVVNPTGWRLFIGYNF
ncbi:MAG: hypothetical protein MJE63_03575, partial [Proteobacteria bacterium]|nr:hypothetical protein [Pseudomonadota bacterium]